MTKKITEKMLKLYVRVKRREVGHVHRRRLDASVPDGEKVERLVQKRYGLKEEDILDNTKRKHTHTHTFIWTHTCTHAHTRGVRTARLKEEDVLY